MAKMLPPAVREKTSSKAERKLFRRIRDEVPDDWYALHSLGLAGHDRKPWAELDFVLVGPEGVFCLEVKGGRIARRDGRWVFTDGAGRSSTKDEGPFEQVGSGSAALAKYLFAQMPSLRSSVLGYAVATPDQSAARLTGPDVIKEVLYDEGDTSRPFIEFLSRVGEYWHERLGRERGLTTAEIRAVVDKLRGDFDLRPSIRAQVAGVLDELVALTAEQSSALEGLVDSPRAIIRGGAGTGKTMLAIEEALRWAGHDKRVLLTCFGRNLAYYIRASLADESVHVEHFHGLLTRVVREAGLETRLPDAEASDLYEVFYPELALEALLDDGAERYDVVIVDEAQDLLLDTYLDVFDALLVEGLSEGTWRFFLDPRQNVFDSVQSEQLHHLESFAPARYRLTKNCRNTIPIAIHTALLSGREIEETLRAEGPAVKVLWYSDDADQASKVAREVRSLLNGGLKPEEIAILSPHRMVNSPTMQRVGNLGNGVVDLGAGPEGLKGSKIRFSSIAGFKGMESDVVVLVDGDSLSDDARDNFYVAASRAMALLVVLLRADQRARYDTLAETLGERMLVDVDQDTPEP
jgi:ATP:corrinoid adenosyltransferase